MLQLFVRLVISMAVVMAVMGLAARFLRRRQGMGPLPRATQAPRRGRQGQGGAIASGAGQSGQGGLDQVGTVEDGLAGAGQGTASSSSSRPRFWDGGWSRRNRPAPLIEVPFRRSLAKGSCLAVVEAGGKRFLVGVTEQSVTLLADLPGQPEASVPAPTVDLAATATEEVAAAPDGAQQEAGRMPTSPESATDQRSDSAWKLAIDSLRERTVRR
ncbi:MAG TPA: flagellar biosynthetic protein FliO [Acidimicrobiales bacterium]|nr:flagellar biosynthetic protein FliO [Acidimicrobiales bacterium]